jgi:hypothetical protein
MRVIDPWINVDMPEWGDPDWMVRVSRDYLGSPPKALERKDLAEVLELMDAAGVEKAVIDLNLDAPSKHSLSFIEARPDRFSLALRLDPRGHMATVRKLREMTASLPVAMARSVPFLVERPADHRDYYPIYAACVDLGLPISINAGIAGPPVPSMCQNPAHLDQVCYDFPELTVIMAHGADPWWDVAIRLMIKYPGLHLMTSAYRPKYLPRELLAFMERQVGSSKILFASDYPLLDIAPLVEDAQRLNLSADVLDAYLYGNAKRLLFRD